MLTASRAEDKSELSAFEIIYQAAKIQDANTIKKILSDVCIDVQYAGQDTPVSRLAAEGNTDAVNFLINKFNASKLRAAYGYAQGRYIPQAETLLKQAAPEERFAVLQNMIYGYARGGHAVAARELFKSAAREDRFFLLKEMVWGFAVGGHEDYANETLKLATAAERPVLLKSMALGYIQGKNPAKAEKILKWVNFHVDHRHLSLYMIFAHGLCGNETAANEILGQAHADDKLKFLQYLACGYAIGGHISPIKKLLNSVTFTQRIAILNCVLYGYAQGGYVKEVDRICNDKTYSAYRNTFIKQKAAGLANGGHLRPRDIQQYVKQVPTYNRFDLLKEMMFESARGGQVKAAKAILLEARNSEERLELSKEMAYGLSSDGHVSTANEVLRYIVQQKPQDRFDVIKKMAYYYVHAGQVNAANELLVQAADQVEWLAILKEIITRSSDSGFLVAANDTLKFAGTSEDRTNLIKDMIQTLNKRWFANEENSLQTLAAFKGNFQQEIVNVLKTTVPEQKRDLTHLLPKASKLNEVLNSQPVNFRQAMAWIQPDLQIWLLQCLQLVRKDKISKDIFLMITQYLLPVKLDQNELVDLSNSLILYTRRQRFFQNASTQYCVAAKQLITHLPDVEGTYGNRQTR